jgi:hypothetical protein
MMGRAGADGLALALGDAAGYPAPPAMFVAGDDAARKPLVLGLVADLGFEAIDAGPLRIARLLEPYAMLWIDQAVHRGAQTDNAFAFMRRPGAAALSRRAEAPMKPRPTIISAQPAGSGTAEST